MASRLQLPPDLTAASRARRWVTDALADFPDDLADAVRVVATELVTNAVLHGGRPIELRLTAGDGRVLIEVSDGTRAAPRPKRFALTADTGRGLLLVAGMSTRWGVEIRDDRKVVWAELLAGSPAAVEDPGPAGTLRDARRTVRILGLPVAVYLAAEEHDDALIRELILLAAGEASPSTPETAVPVRLAELAAAVPDELRRSIVGLREQVQAALGAGSTTVDLSFEVPAVGWDAATAMAASLDEIDRFCDQGELLTLASPPEVRRFRAWMVEEVTRQLAGHDPRPWPPPRGAE